MKKRAIFLIVFGLVDRRPMADFRGFLQKSPLSHSARNTPILVTYETDLSYPEFLLLSLPLSPYLLGRILT